MKTKVALLYLMYSITVLQIYGTGMCVINEAYISAFITGWAGVFTFILAKKVRKRLEI